jgi:hypothetical protein
MEGINMKTIIIKLYDNEHYQYPLIEIKEGNLFKFKNTLKRYQKKDTYNLDDFIDIISKKEYFVRAIYFDEEIYF